MGPHSHLPRNSNSAELTSVADVHTCIHRPERWLFAEETIAIKSVQMTEHLETMPLTVQQFKIFTNLIMSSGSMSISL